MSETIQFIREVEYRKRDKYGSEAGYEVGTSQRLITCMIDADQDCCESWGYFMSLDDLESFIGSTLLSIEKVDSLLNVTEIPEVIRDYRDPSKIDMDEGDVMFVNFNTDRGTFQFVAYNAHNGYYSHEARITSRAMTDEVMFEAYL